jgi:hypothetical protein
MKYDTSLSFAPVVFQGRQINHTSTSTKSEIDCEPHHQPSRAVLPTTPGTCTRYVGST